MTRVLLAVYILCSIVVLSKSRWIENDHSGDEMDFERQIEMQWRNQRDGDIRHSSRMKEGSEFSDINKKINFKKSTNKKPTKRGTSEDRILEPAINSEEIEFEEMGKEVEEMARDILLDRKIAEISQGVGKSISYVENSYDNEIQNKYKTLYIKDSKGRYLVITHGNLPSDKLADIPIRCGRSVHRIRRTANRFYLTIDTRIKRCQIYVNLKKQFRLPYTFTLRKEIIHKFGPDEILKISQGRAVQKYRNGTFSITKLPAEDLELRIEYINYGVVRYGSIDIDIVLREIEHHSLPLGSYPFYNKAMKHFERESGQEVKTYDPKYAAFQPCPDYCGRFSSSDPHVRTFLGGLTNTKSVPSYVRIEIIITRDDGSEEIKTCGGVILNSRTVLTAATCVTFPDILKISQTETFVYVGNEDLDHKNTEEQKIRTYSEEPHPEFAFLRNKVIAQQYNIGLLFLEKDIIFGVSAAPICLSPPRNYEGVRANIFGFENHNKDQTRLRSGEVTLHHDYGTTDQVLGYITVHERTRESCGDLGSPVIITMRDTQFLVGIVVQSPNCRMKSIINEPKLHLTNITMYQDFLLDQIDTDTDLC